MRLTDVSVHSLSCPIEPKQVRPFYGGFRRLHKRDFVLAIVETADGRIGYAPAGASSSAMREYFEDASHDSFAELLETRVADAVAGVELDSPGDLDAAIRHLGLPTKLESEAISVLDVAYHDLWGKEVGEPVYELLADRDVEPEPLDMYASSGMYMDPEGYAEQASAIKVRGFDAYKYRPAGPPEEDVETLRRIRERVGDDMDIMVDAHTWWKLGDNSYDYQHVERLLDEFEAYDPYWIEEPVEPADYGAYERLAAATDVPLAGGESEESPDGLRQLAGTGVDYLQGDVRHHCGFTGCWELVEACADDDAVTFVPHNFGTHLGLVANAHLITAASETPLLEYPVFGTDVAGMYPFPLAEDVLETDLDVADGTLTLPDGPGLGVDVDEGVIDEYPHIDGPWTEFVYEENAGDAST
jgi:L-alanine-DL-glutamate epimerase-like enolase superfamily enzyme